MPGEGGDAVDWAVDRELGYVEGKNFSLEFINVEGQLDRYGDAMKELVRRNVDIVLAPGPEIALKSAVAATQTLPIVTIAMDYDVVAKGTSKACRGRAAT